MPRHKDINWNLPEGKKDVGATRHSWESINAALLMDIRDELKEIKELLQPLQRLNCPHFLRIPSKLDRIGRNTQSQKKANVTRKLNRSRES